MKNVANKTSNRRFKNIVVNKYKFFNDKTNEIYIYNKQENKKNNGNDQKDANGL